MTILARLSNDESLALLALIASLPDPSPQTLAFAERLQALLAVDAAFRPSAPSR
jgi:hypothetical protein